MDGTPQCALTNAIARAGESDRENNTRVDGAVKVKMQGEVNGDGIVDVRNISSFPSAIQPFMEA